MCVCVCMFLAKKLHITAKESCVFEKETWYEGMYANQNVVLIL